MILRTTRLRRIIHYISNKRTLVLVTLCKIINPRCAEEIRAAAGAEPLENGVRARDLRFFGCQAIFALGRLCWR